MPQAKIFLNFVIFLRNKSIFAYEFSSVVFPNLAACAPTLDRLDLLPSHVWNAIKWSKFHIFSPAVPISTAGDQFHDKFASQIFGEEMRKQMS